MARAALWLALSAALAGGWTLVNPRIEPRAGREAPERVEPALREEPRAEAGLTAAQRLGLEEAARRLAPALMHVGHPGGDAGTGFVISKARRLVATNAHVATILDETGSLVAVAPSDGHRYRVTRAWYHPDYRRACAQGVILRGGAVSIYSRSVGPDVAVLELEASGPEPAAECRLAGRACAEALEGMAVGKLGFAGPLDARGPGRPARFEAGSVSEVRPIAARWDLSQRWRLVDASASMRHGESGGPLFLADGRVVAINAWGRRPSSDVRFASDRTTRTTALWIDALRELLHAHALVDPREADGFD